MVTSNESEQPSIGRSRRDLPRTLADRIGFLLHLTADEIRALVDKDLSTLGLKGLHYGLLSLLEETEAISQQQASQRLLIDRTTMVALVDDLERQGRVERRRDPDDRRRHALYLTASGRALLKEAHDGVTAVESRFCAPLSGDERAVLKDLLTRLDQQAPELEAPSRG